MQALHPHYLLLSRRTSCTRSGAETARATSGPLGHDRWALPADPGHAVAAPEMQRLFGDEMPTLDNGVAACNGMTFVAMISSSRCPPTPTPADPCRPLPTSNDHRRPPPTAAPTTADPIPNTNDRRRRPPPTAADPTLPNTTDRRQPPPTAACHRPPPTTHRPLPSTPPNP